MGKLILFLFIIGVIYFLFFKKNAPKPSNDEEEFLMCDKCKTFMPKSKIKKIGNKNICKECYDNT